MANIFIHKFLMIINLYIVNLYIVANKVVHRYIG